MSWAARVAIAAAGLGLGVWSCSTDGGTTGPEQGAGGSVDAGPSGGEGGAEPVDAGVDGPVDSGPPDWCGEQDDGLWCDGDDLVTCSQSLEISREPCSLGCIDGLPPDDAYCRDWCFGRIDGKYCDGDDLLYCYGQREAYRLTCPSSCTTGNLFTPSRCEAVPFCTQLPSVSADPPSSTCPFDQYDVELIDDMEWLLSPDGFYLVHRFFGTDQDPDMPIETSCGLLQSHYQGHGCRYDHHVGCLDSNSTIEGIYGTVLYDYVPMIATTWEHLHDDVPAPEYFYVAGAQRFSCGAVLRISNTQIGRCVVAYAEHGGPAGPAAGTETANARRSLDVSPAVAQYLLLADDPHTYIGQAHLVHVEWGAPGDIPGQACTPCGSVAAAQGSENSRTPWDLNHLVQQEDCRL